MLPAQVQEGKSLSRDRALLVRKHLRQILNSHAFARSQRAQDFLSLVVRHAISGRFSSLRERNIGAELFGRPIDYDTGSDSVVRVMATEVRKRLIQYYLEASPETGTVRFELPSGSYVPQFIFSAEDALPLSGELAGPEPASAPEVEVPESASTAEPETVSLSSETVQEPRRGRAWPWRAALALLFLGALALAAYKLWMRFGAHPLAHRSVVVLPLRNISEDPNQDLLADGMTAELINDMSQISSLRVISLNSSMNLKGTSRAIPEIARELGVQDLIQGTVHREGNRVIVNIQLLDGGSGRPLWEQAYWRDMNDVLGLQRAIVADLTHAISTSVSSQDQSLLSHSQFTNQNAHDAYLHGVLQLNAESDEYALANFRQAAQADPNSAQIHAAIAECLGRLAVSGLEPYHAAFTMQKDEASKAVALDPMQAEAHAELAEAALALDWDWQTAQQEYRRALQLKPNSSYIHQKYAIFLLFRGELNEAIQQVESSVDLDPISAVSLRNEAFVYYFARQNDKALSLTESIHALGFEPPGWNFFLGAVYTEKGQYTKAMEWFQKVPMTPHTLGHFGNAEALAGDKAKAQKCIASLEEQFRKNGIGAYEIALVYTGLGDKKKALDWLNQALAVHDVGLLYIKIDPCLDPLRQEPEFQQIIRRIGLQP
jgi:TolB-like protein